MSRKFLYEFHEEAKIEEAKQRRTAEPIAYIPEETEALRGLGLVNRELGGSWGGAVPSSESPPWTRMPRSSKAGSRKPCEPTRERGAISRCWRQGRDERGVWPNEFRDANV